MKDFAKSIVCNTKVGNGLKDDMKRAHPNDSMVDDVKTSATYEAIVKQPWRVYDILGADDSMIREYAFELIAKKYGVDYNTIYYAWLHNGYKLSDHKGPTNQEKAKRDFQKLGVSVSNTKTCNSNKAEIIEKKKKEGATLKVDNGQKLEFSDGSTYVKTSFSDDYREAHNYTGNTKAGNATIVDLMGQAKEYSTKFWESHKKGDQKEAEKWFGYAKILKRQIAEERSDIQQRLKNLNEAEKLIGFAN